MGLIRKRVLGVAGETTEGTFNTPSTSSTVGTTSSILIYDPKFEIKPDLFRRNPARNNLSPLNPVTGILRGKLTFKCEVRGPDDISSNLGVPELDMLLRGCAMKRVDTGSRPTARAYKPTSTMKPHLTTTLAASASLGSGVSMQVASSTGFAVGDVVSIYTPSTRAAEEQATITAIADSTHITATIVANHSSSDIVERCSASIPLSLELQDDDKSYRWRGCRGNVKLSAKVGEIGMYEFSFEGAVASTPTDSYTAFAPSYGAKVPPAFFSAGLNLGGAYSSATFTAIDFDLANVLVPRENANSSTGLLSTLVTGREPKGTFDPESVTEATYTYWANLLASTGASLSVAIGGTSKNRVTVTSPAIVLDTISDNDRTAIATYGVGFSCVTTSSSGDDELVFTYD